MRRGGARAFARHGGNLTLATGMRLKRDGDLGLIRGLYAMCPYIAGRWPQERFPSSIGREGPRTAARNILRHSRQSLAQRSAGAMSVAFIEPVTLTGDPYVGLHAANFLHASNLHALGYALTKSAPGTAEMTPERAVTAARTLLGGPDRPTALLCFSDVYAAHAIRAAEDLGLRVPEDLSVVGYDDADFASTFRPALTTIRQEQARRRR